MSPTDWTLQKCRVQFFVAQCVNQLTRENNQSAGRTWVWTYDTGGNITSKKEYEYTTGELGTPIDTISYTYGDEAWGDLLTAYNGTEITHDGIGNPLNIGTRTFYWDNRQLSAIDYSISTWSFLYNSDGLRIARLDEEFFYEYQYTGNTLIHMYVYGNELTFTYDGSTPLTITFNDEVYYYVTNIQGDVIAILDSTGTAVVEYTYDAWGKLLSTSGSLSDSLGYFNPLRYRGYVYDEETALYYLQSRYYDPALGRFLNADAFASTGQGILGNNMFAYCNSNPISFMDITGHSLMPTTVRISDMSGLGSRRVGTISSDDWAEYDKYNHSTTELVNSVEKLSNSKGGEGVAALNQIRSGASKVKKGFGLILAPIPTTADDLIGMVYITHGVLKWAGGVTKFIIWVVKE